MKYLTDFYVSRVQSQTDNGISALKTVKFRFGGGGGGGRVRVFSSLTYPFPWEYILFAEGTGKQ